MQNVACTNKIEHTKKFCGMKYFKRTCNTSHVVLNAFAQNFKFATVMGCGTLVICVCFANVYGRFYNWSLTKDGLIGILQETKWNFHNRKINL